MLVLDMVCPLLELHHYNRSLTTLLTEAVKSLLIDLQAAVTILRLATAIYPVGSWITAVPRSLYPEIEPDPTSEVITESWTLRSDLSNWAWRIISELKADGEINSRVHFFRD